MIGKINNNVVNFSQIKMINISVNFYIINLKTGRVKNAPNAEHKENFTELF